MQRVIGGTAGGGRRNRDGRASTHGPGAEPQRGRIHALRAARARDRVVQDRLRRHRGDARREVLLQPDPHRQRRDRRVGHRPDDRRAAEVPGSERRRGARVRPSRTPASTAATSASSSRGRCRRAAKAASASSRPTRIRRATSATATRSCSIARSASSATRRAAARATSSCRATFPSQVIEETDGRVGISFMNTYPGQAPLVLRAQRRSRQTPAAPAAATATVTPSTPADPAPPLPPMERVRVSERAFQDREIVYFLKSPETHAFSLYHDYTETREGTDKYVNVVRAGQHRVGSVGEDPRHRRGAEDRDAQGAAITEAKVDIGEPVRADSRSRRDPVPAGQERAERAAANRGDLHRSGALRPHRRPADVASQLRPAAQRHRAAGRAGI